MGRDEVAHQTLVRKLVIENLINGVPLEVVAQAFCRTTADVMRDFDFAVAKMKSYAFERRMPAFTADTVAKARKNKQVFLHFLDRVNLTIEPKYGKISVNTLDEGTAKAMGLFS